LWLSACAGASEFLKASTPSAKVTGVRLTDLNLDHVTLGFDVEVTNPLGVSLPLVDVAYELSSSDTPFLDGRADVGGAVPARSAKIVAIPVRLDFARTLDLLQQFRPGNEIPYVASLTLSVDPPGLAPLALPLRKQGSFPIPAVPKVTVKGIDADEVSPTRVAGTLKLGITNTNDFALGLQRLDYALDLAGVRVADETRQETAEFRPGEAGELAIPLGFSPLSASMALVQALLEGRTDYGVRGNLSVETPFGPLEFPFDGAGQTDVTQ
jgi:LEA14-like dessication related protein